MSAAAAAATLRRSRSTAMSSPRPSPRRNTSGPRMPSVTTPQGLKDFRNPLGSEFEQSAPPEIASPRPTLLVECSGADQDGAMGNGKDGDRASPDSAARQLRYEASRRRQETRKQLSVCSEYTATMETRCPRLVAFVRSDQFEAFVGFVILANCVTMGIEAEQLLGKGEGLETFVLVSEQIFTTLFCLEIVLRLFVFSWRSYLPLERWGGSPWQFLDMLLVLFTGVLVVWILPAFGHTAGSELQMLTVFRCFRLVRLVRIVQRVEAFHEVWLLLRGLTESGRVLFWTCLVIFFITYVFAVLGVVLISVELKEEYQASVLNGSIKSDLEELVEVTDGVWATMNTLIQVLTLDSWNSIARPMQNYISWSWIYFYLYIAVAVIVMMNLVTAIIVDNALKNSQKDAADIIAMQEKERERELAHFRHIFELMDVNGDGELTWSEFEVAFEDDELCTKLKMYGIERENCREMFELLDSGDGVISMQEFFEGIAKMDGPAESADLFRNTKTNELLVKLLIQQNSELQEDIGEIIQHTPGAKLHERPHSLRRRACRLPVNQILRTNSGERRSPSGPAQPVLQHSASNQRVTSAEIMQKLSEVASALNENRQEIRQIVSSCSENIEGCSRRIEAVSTDLAELRSSLSKEPRPRGAPDNHRGSPVPRLLLPPSPVPSDAPTTRSAWSSKFAERSLFSGAVNA